MLRLLRSFPRIFITCSDYSTGTLSAEHLFSEHLLLDTCFTVNYFLMNRIGRSFNISNFISSRSQVFGRADVFKRLRNIHMKAPVLECILIKLQASNLQSETLIKKGTPEQVFSCESWKNFKNTFL